MRELNEQELKESKLAEKFIKKNKKFLIDRFCNKQNYPPVEVPFTFFMAGSPGAGKTETSKSLIKILEPIIKGRIARIDADDIKEIIPQYTGCNSDVVHGASALGVEKLFDYVMHNQINVILDGTLANYNVAEGDVSRAIAKKRPVAIFYIYQDPLLAWDFTKKREKLEGRTVPKYIFIKSFFRSYGNVNRLKKKFKKNLFVFFIKKDYNNNVAEIHTDVSNLDKYLKIGYTKESLNKKLNE